MTLNAQVEVLAVMNTGTGSGDIGNGKEYGKASTVGFEGDVGLDYSITRNVFLRASARVESIGMTFQADPNAKTNNRDADPTTQDVQSARDTYFGGAVTIGYLY
jgi:hypothetical protein